MIIQCKCECGTEFEEFDKWGRKREYVSGHHRRGKTHSPETRQLISKSHKGKIFTDKHRKNLSDANIGKHPSDATRQLLSIVNSGENNPNYGKHLSPEAKQKMSEDRKGKYCGENNPMFGKTHSPETRQLMSKIRKGKYCGKNNPQWKGGIAYEPYCQEFDRWFKEEIKNRDNYQCQNPDCNKEITKTNLLGVHHIDYNKKNCSTNNLITICRSCNSRANANRDYWKEFYNNIKTR